MRKASTIALGEIGPTARSALAALRRAAEDEDGAVREAAVIAIANVSGRSQGE